jgi:hypothetical protein
MQMGDPEFGIGLESGGRGERPKPGWPLRILEGVGLAALLYGLADANILWILLGAAAIVSSYAIYRKRHGRFPSDGSSESGSSDGDGDGGGGD